MDKIKAVFGAIGVAALLMGGYWIYNVLDRVEELEKITTMQSSVIQQKDALIAAQAANTATLQELAKHRQAFEKQLSDFIGKTDKQLKRVLANDKEARTWWDSHIPTAVLRMHKGEPCGANSNSQTTTATRKVD